MEAVVIRYIKGNIEADIEDGRKRGEANPGRLIPKMAKMKITTFSLDVHL